ncbi:MAG: M43 family zinc metalloprotease [Crocinitomicaceae bacterium]
MKSSILLTSTLLALSTIVLAQTKTAPTHPEFCGQHHQQEKIYESNPSLRIQDSVDQAEFQQNYEDFLLTYDPNARSTYTIPVVVHVVHLNGSENISKEQIDDALVRLNEDFNMSNPDVGNTIADFSGIVGNADFEFKLATKDPNGNCHSGITRTFSNTTYDVGQSGGSHPIVNAVAAEHGVWPQNRYMSIFVCIDPIGAAGYTYNPSNGFPQNQMRGAIFMRHDYMGIIGTSSSGRRHTLAHEVGHWLNLSHLWGSTNSPNVASNCNVDDGVNDTPNTIGWQSCVLQGTSCGSLDNVQNIMEYSYCSTMFTQGQVARMHAAINSNTAGRSNLITNSNLAAAGVLGPSTDVCEAKFISNTQVICQGQSIDFSDISVHGITGRNWTFAGGFPASSSDSVITVTYSSAGDYSVTLEVSNATGSETTTITNYIKVLSVPGSSFPYSEGFENLTATNFPDDLSFAVVNPGNDETWEIKNGEGSTGSKCLYINNHAANTIDEDQLISGTIDLSVLSSSDDLEMTFDYAYSKRFSDNNEQLRVFVSNNCGISWSLRKVIQGTILGNGTLGGPYTPSDDDWKTVTISNISSSFYVPEFRYMIQFESDQGNNIYIDNINLSAEGFLSTEGIEQQNQSITVFPNPTANISTVALNGYNNQDVVISLHDVMGRKISEVYAGNISTGAFKTEVNTELLSDGLYFINIVSEGVKAKTIKLVKE